MNMKLTAEEKVNMIKTARELLKNKSPKNSQIRKYSSLAMQAECYDEFENYLKYQIGRAQNNEINFLNETLSKINQIKGSESDDAKCLLKIAYLFGVMAREKQYKEKIERDDKR